jgi:dCMP deaminase
MSMKWDVRFLELARLVSGWSKDPSTKTGAVLVRPDKTVASVGFNGFPAGMNDSESVYADRELKYKKIIHCEMNAMLHAHGKVLGCTLYTWPFACCERCVVHMISTGITRFVYPPATPDALTRWSASFCQTMSFMQEANVAFDEIDIETRSLQHNWITTSQEI